MKLISAHNVSYRYPNGTNAISEISFAVEQGERIALIGHNGSGKSTLLLLLGAIILPTGGKLVISERELTRKTQSAIRKRVGMLFTQVEYQFIMPDCLNDVMLSITEGTKEDRKAAAMQYLRNVNLERHAHQNPIFLSSGEMKRAALASILAKQPEFLLLDEPLANLDKPSCDAVIKILESIDIAIIFATHARHAVEALAKRTIVLTDGNLAYDGPSTSREAKNYYDKILL